MYKFLATLPPKTDFRFKGNVKKIILREILSPATLLLSAKEKVTKTVPVEAFTVPFLMQAIPPFSLVLFEKFQFFVN